MASTIGAMGAVQVAMIAASQPPSYDQGGYSHSKGLYQTGDIGEWHIPLPSGQKIPVEAPGGTSPTEITILNAVDPSMLDQYLASSRGQDAIINIIGSRSTTIRRVLR